MKGASRMATHVIRLGYRVLLLALASADLAIMIATHDIPLNQHWDVPLVLGSWLPVAAVVVTLTVKARRLGRPALRRILRLVAPLRKHLALYVFCAIMVGILAATGAVAVVGNRDMSCRGGPATCIKLNQYSESGGAFYRKYPYDAAGVGDSNAPWTPISRAEYIAEVGTKIRSAGVFATVALLLATFGSVLEEGLALARRETNDAETMLAAALTDQA